MSDRVAVAARVLVVDDDPAVTRILRSMLELDGYEVDQLTTAVGLAERLVETPPDLVLLDVHMPEFSGLDVLEALGESTVRRIPIIMLTGESENVQLAVETIKRGALDYLVKPVSMERLLQAVRGTLRLHRMRRELERTQQQLARAVDSAQTAQRELARVRHLALERREQLLAVLAVSPRPTLVVEATSLRVVGSNSLATALLGATPGEASGSCLSDYLDLSAEPWPTWATTGCDVRVAGLPSRSVWIGPASEANLEGAWLVLELNGTKAGSRDRRAPTV